MFPHYNDRYAHDFSVSANKIKRYLAKLPDYAGSCLRDIFVDVMSETAKKDYLAVISRTLGHFSLPQL